MNFESPNRRSQRIAAGIALPLILIFAGTASLRAQESAQATQTWSTLFNGKDLQGWTNPFAWGHASVIDGELRLSGSKRFYLISEKSYRDFVFEGEVFLPEGPANSGFLFRCRMENGKVAGYQAEVDGSDRRWSGGLFQNQGKGWIWPRVPRRSEGEPGGEDREHIEKSFAFFSQSKIAAALDRDGWNKFRITCKGSHLKIEVNGVITTELDDKTDSSGFIALEHHGEKGRTYRFRNLRVAIIN